MPESDFTFRAEIFRRPGLDQFLEATDGPGPRRLRRKNGRRRFAPRFAVDRTRQLSSLLRWALGGRLELPRGRVPENRESFFIELIVVDLRHKKILLLLFSCRCCKRPGAE